MAEPAFVDVATRITLGKSAATETPSATIDSPLPATSRIGAPRSTCPVANY